MEFLVLGPVESRVAGQVVDLGPTKQQCVLAALLWSAGRPVPVESLIERVWGDQPPNQARSSVYAYVARLRRVIERADADPPVQLTKSGHGYRLQVRPEQVDLSRYRELTSQSRRIGVTGEQRIALLRDAMALWRDDPLSGIQGDWASRVRDSLVAGHLGMLAEWAGAELALGRPGVVVERLAPVLAQHPFNEALVELMMTGLCLGGRSEEALQVFRRYRARLADEVGRDPGPAVRELELRILRDDLALRPPERVTPTGIPRQLPSEAPPLTAESVTGRSACAAVRLWPWLRC